MATVYGVNRTKIEAGNQADMPDPEENSSGVRWVYDYYVAALINSTSPIYLGLKLPVGARIVDWKIDHEALASAALKGKFGTAASDACFMAYADIYAVAIKTLNGNGVSQSLGKEISSGDDQTLVITLSGASSGTGTIKVAVAYTAMGG